MKSLERGWLILALRVAKKAGIKVPEEVQNRLYMVSRSADSLVPRAKRASSLAISILGGMSSKDNAGQINIYAKFLRQQLPKEPEEMAMVHPENMFFVSFALMHSDNQWWKNWRSLLFNPLVKK